MNIELDFSDFDGPLTCGVNGICANKTLFQIRLWIADLVSPAKPSYSTATIQAPDALALKIWGMQAEMSKNALVLITSEGRVFWCNSHARDVFNLSCGDDALSTVVPEAAPDGLAPDSALFRGLHLSNRQDTGTIIWLLQQFVRVECDGTILIASTTQNVSAAMNDAMTSDILVAAQETKLKHDAYHDELTGLANRRHLNHFMDSAEFKEAMARRAVGALLLDVDKFKEFNDTLGHAAGDASLIHMARALEKVLGPNDIACRTGGDEFVVFCLDLTDQKGLIAKAELILRDIAQEVRWHGQSIRMGASIGASLCSESDTIGEDLLHHADQALYAAKSLGRGRVVFFTPQIGQVQRAQNQMAYEVRGAVSQDQLEILLQPQLDAFSDVIIGCEALLRWNHPRLGQIPPGAFFQTARSAGVLSQLDYHAMQLSLDALQALNTAGFHDLSVSINVSAEVLADANYPGLLDWAVQSRGLQPDRVCIEVKEMTIHGAEAEAMKTAIERLKDFGARVALDDFGTGYSGLSHMSDSGMDAIKLDRSLIARIETEHRSRAVLKSIVDLCHKLGTSVIAEGVETQAQREILKRAGCPSIQGFGVAVPMTVRETIDWLAQHQVQNHRGAL